MRILLFFLCFLLVGCEEAETPPPEDKKPELVLTQADFPDLPAWGDDDFHGFVQAFDRSCRRILKKSPDEPFGVLKQAGTYGDWQAVCQKFTGGDDWDQEKLKTFFEESFVPYLVSADNNAAGLFTGYYEASLNGSREKTARFNVPLHKRPDDLVMVHLGQFREELKGIRIAGRVTDGTLKPYETRKDIVSGDWPHEGEVLLWVDSAIDAFFVQIQGSGVVQMNDGETVRIGYAGQNGHPYYAIGREIIARGDLSKENVSMQNIRAWLEINPYRAEVVMNTNKSYVFFREIKGEGPLGAEGVPLTAGRSLAVDRTLISYGIPLWVEIEHPDKEQPTMRKMMVAQDTGGAITGPVRGDVFWGYGAHAEAMAGIMKSQGHYWVLLPKAKVEP